MGISNKFRAKQNKLDDFDYQNRTHDQAIGVGLSPSVARQAGADQAEYLRDTQANALTGMADAARNQQAYMKAAGLEQQRAARRGALDQTAALQRATNAQMQDSNNNAMSLAASGRGASIGAARYMAAAQAGQGTATIAREANNTAATNAANFANAQASIANTNSNNQLDAVNRATTSRDAFARQTETDVMKNAADTANASAAEQNAKQQMAAKQYLEMLQANQAGAMQADKVNADITNQNAERRFKNQQAWISGITGAVGAGAGVAAMMSDEDSKEDFVLLGDDKKKNNQFGPNYNDYKASKEAGDVEAKDKEERGKKFDAIGKIASAFSKGFTVSDGNSKTGVTPLPGPGGKEVTENRGPMQITYAPQEYDLQTAFAKDPNAYKISTPITPPHVPIRAPGNSLNFDFVKGAARDFSDSVTKGYNRLVNPKTPVDRLNKLKRETTGAVQTGLAELQSKPVPVNMWNGITNKVDDAVKDVRGDGLFNAGTKAGNIVDYMQGELKTALHRVNDRPRGAPLVQNPTPIKTGTYHDINPYTGQPYSQDPKQYTADLPRDGMKHPELQPYTDAWRKDQATKQEYAANTKPQGFTWGTGNAEAVSDKRSKEVDKTFDKLKPYQYRYKENDAEEMAQDYENPVAAYNEFIKPRVGIMAQDMEKSPMGKEAVKETNLGPNDRKVIDRDKALSLSLAEITSLNERLKKLEKKGK